MLNSPDMGLVSVPILSPVGEGTVTRAAAASSGTEVVAIGFPIRLVQFSSVNDADSSVLSDGWDTGTVATCARSNSVTLLATLISTQMKDATNSIYVATALGAGWRAHITAIGTTTFTLTWTKIGGGLAVTVKFCALL